MSLHFGYHDNKTITLLKGSFKRRNKYLSFEIWLECMLHYLNAEKWLFHTTTVTCNQMKMDEVELDFHRHIELEEETPNLKLLE